MTSLRIQRYLLRETLVPMLLGLAVFTLVLLLGRILNLVELVINKGVPLVDVLLLLAYLLPTFLVLTLPLSFLLGVMAGFGRMSADREILALKACGVGLRQLTAPIVGLGLLVSLATAATTIAIKPASEDLFREKLFHIASSRANIGIQAQIFNDEFEGIILYANDVDERSGRMQGVFISDERDDTLSSIILANEGRIFSNQENLTLTLHLENGTIHRQRRETGSGFQVIEFTRYDLNLDLGQTSMSADQPRKNKKTMTLGELYQAIRPDAATPPSKKRELLAEFHWRLAVPVIPLLFALLGVPLGIQPVRSGRGSGFAAGLLVFLAYYVLLSLAGTLVVDAGLPGLIMWGPNSIFLLASIVVLRAAAKEKPLPLVEFCRRWTDILIRRLRK
ncbi:lipopolysaccharide ABC transporter, membrane protein LptF [Syntrophotalea carbinolica DSM 2380]|uniref:Lipopolysaccharide ABC transporter, membrane protein LptF n=1 Tax=Syntrophotalea carbinolica (strain DSM 2380 / NBRC 103641 / GraBd1) TaxID=338963 RepID=Q3A394_SYNC1|nr:LPS export ABC transporter permease LptF [Syntrophotalea carbinolica]ABA89163.2 lipopolysaccharide ABC transporter, membrane protein LptF [Syntrophotalea carbinolica DSM 2380]